MGLVLFNNQTSRFPDFAHLHQKTPVNKYRLHEIYSINYNVILRAVILVYLWFSKFPEHYHI